MKHLKFLALLLAMITSVSFIASCGSDDNDNSGSGQNPTGGVVNNALVGTWQQAHSWGAVTLTFKKDGTGYYTEIDNYYSYSNDEPEEFKWGCKGQKLTIAYWMEPYYDSYSSEPGGWEYEYFEIVSVNSKTLVLKRISEEEDSYYSGSYNNSVEIWTKQ